MTVTGHKILQAHLPNFRRKPYTIMGFITLSKQVSSCLNAVAYLVCNLWFYYP